MFCVNCGKEVGDADQFCGGCGSKAGVAKQPDTPLAYQPPLGQQVSPGYGYQQHGPPLPGRNVPFAQPEYAFKKKVPTLLLCIFLGWYGGHRFYVGKTGSAIGMLALGVLYSVFYIADLFDPGGLIYVAGVFGVPLFIWWIVDLIKICVNKFTDKNGRPLQKG